MLRRRNPLHSTVGAALCAAALLAQATLLPLLHGEHGPAAGLEHALAFAHAGGTFEPGLHDDACVPRASHDAAACRLCATLAGAGAAVAPRVLHIAAARIVAGRIAVGTDRPAAAPVLSRAAARGPPALVS